MKRSATGPRWRPVIYSLLAWLFISLSGCASLSTFQGPQTLPEGQWQLGVGASGIRTEEGISPPIIVEVSARHGLARSLDGGVKVTIPGTITGDVKWQWSHAPGMMGAFDFALSYFAAPDEDYSSLAFIPALILGGKYWYAGGKLVFFTSEGNVSFFGSRSDFQFSTTLPGLFFGLRLGKRVSILPEVNLYFLPEDPDLSTFLHWGIGIQGHF